MQPTTPASGLSDEEIAQFAECVRGLPGLAILVAQVDPDGIGSALGLSAIARSLGVEAEVYYAGVFGHPQTLSMWEAFGLAARVRRFAEFDGAVPVALVDSSKARDARFGDATLDPVIIIDHHGDPLVDIGPGRFHYVRPMGASCTMVAELAARLGIPFDRELSTLVALGIHSDTNGFAYPGTRSEDRHAYARLMDVGDQELLSSASRFLMSERAYSVVQRLLTHRPMYGSVLLATAPAPLNDGEGEYLALAADFLVQHEDARLVLVIAAVGDHVRVSARTRESALPLGAILEQLFGPTGGAKECSGGALLPLPSGLRTGQRVNDRFQEFRTRLEARLAELDLPTVF